MYTIRHYVTESGVDVFQEWIDGLSDLRGKAKILTRLDRLEAGNPGDCKPVGSGVSELREDFGPGYRVYFAQTGKVVLLLLCGGDKSSQKKDIQAAKKLLEDFQRRTK